MSEPRTPFGVIPEPSALPIVYIFCYGAFLDGRALMAAVSEDGEVLGRHTCDHSSFALGDLHNQRARHAAYEAKYGGWGDGQFYKVIQVPVGEEPPAEVMEAIRAKNAAAEEVPDV